MRNLTRFVWAAASLAASGLVFSALQPGRLMAASSKDVIVAAVVPTHVGVGAADLVRLEGIAIPAGATFQRRLLDGTVDSGPATHGYVVPTGMVLVITDVDWRYDGAAPSASISLTLTTRNAAFNEGNFAFMSSALADAGGDGGASDSSTTGFAVAAGRNLLAHTAGATLQYVVLRGYLKPL